MAVGMDSPRAPFSCDPERRRGRLFSEAESRTRSAFRRDCDRVIHSTAFRRLKHKTQVFVFHEGDHYRTRLTPVSYTHLDVYKRQLPEQCGP